VRRLALATALFLGACTGPAPAPSPSTSPEARSGTNTSVLLITIDTLRADHMGLYGYRRATTPKLDAFGRDAAVFDRAYTFWPKTRGSFVMMMTGRRPSQNGYGKNHQVLLDFNATIASSLQAAGYRTAAIVDNPNVAKSLGYAKGFSSFRETWEEPALASEVDRAHAITQGGASFLRSAAPDKPFFLWLHYVSPHAPYTPPPPYDTMFAADGDAGPRLGVVDSFHGGIPKQWHVAGKDRLAWYVSQYDGEIAAVDAEVGQVLEALAASPSAGNTLVVVTSDHGESLGEHDYYFDHGENLFDPSLHVPLIVAAPGRKGGLRSDALASTLDVFPTILDAAKISWPPDLAGESLLSAATGGAEPKRERLFAQNERHLSASFDERYKIVSVPSEAGGARYAFFDRAKDPGETHDLAPGSPEALRPARRELELFLERSDREWSATRYRVGDAPGEGKMSHDACEKLRALGYVSTCAP
jgi:arylsulfatase A-like enzyme